MKTILILVLLAALGGAAFLLFRDSRMTQENYDKLSLGMRVAEVEKILGPGRKTESGGIGIGSLSIDKSEVRWETLFGKKIAVTFVNDRLVTKSQDGL
jgi:hypothetical protein